MKRAISLSLFAALVSGAAMAQTQVGNVTITRPSTVKVVVTPAPVKAAPAKATPAKNQTTAQAAVPADLPAGWRYLTGRIVAPQNVRLPEGSKAQVSIVEVDRNGGQRATHLNIGFKTTALSTPYSVQYNPARMNSTQNKYLLRAKVFAPDGKLLYMTKDMVEVPKARAATLNIPVSR